MKDVNGTEIKVGSVVRALHEPLGNSLSSPVLGQPERWHNFFGTSKVIEVLTNSVLVEKTCPAHYPAHVPELLVVVP